MKRIRVRFCGIVQGVFFRKQTRDIAKSIGLTGWVKNLDNGDVEAVFEGSFADIQEALMQCKNLPLPAKVINADATEEEYTGEFEQFTINFD